MAPFRWKNCMADVYTYKHDLVIQSYFDDVVVPGLAALDAQIAELAASDWPGHEFAHSDMEDVRCEAKLAYGLSIQSIWERQLRVYLRRCATELLPSEMITTKINRANWNELRKWFWKLRGIELEAFPSFETLDTLQHLGNACRHGDGASAVELYRRRPDFWPVVSTMAPAPTVETWSTTLTMDIPIEALREFISAVASFWRDTKYIYNESIEQKHSSLEALLARERDVRQWLPQAPARGPKTS